MFFIIQCSIFAGVSIICNFLLMITWTPAALVFYQRFCCFNPFQNPQGPLPNTEESLPNPAVVAIASTGRLNCPDHLASCNKPCCDKINCICEASSDPSNGEQQKGVSLLCCFKQVLSNCDISYCCCCCMHSCCYSWITGRRKRYDISYISIIMSVCIYYLFISILWKFDYSNFECVISI